MLITIQVYQEDDRSYRAEFRDISYGYGNSIDEAVKALKRETYALKNDLNEQGDDILPQFKEMRDFLNDIIKEG